MRDWEDTDGLKRSTTEIIENQIIMLGTREASDPDQIQIRPVSYLSNHSEPSHQGPYDDDIPFLGEEV